MDAPRTLVITISRQLGAGGAYVGQALARRLGIRYVDRELLQRAAALLGRDEGDLEPFEERAATLWDRIASVLSLGTPEAPFVPPPLPKPGQDELFEAESGIMLEIAAREDAVFVGRGAAWVLRRHPGIVRVFLYAPESWRIRRIQETYAIGDEAAARELVRRIDQQRAAFMHALLGRSSPPPDTFDIWMDTSTVGLETAADFVEQLALRRRERAG